MATFFFGEVSISKAAPRRMFLFFRRGKAMTEYSLTKRHNSRLGSPTIITTAATQIKQGHRDEV